MTKAICVKCGAMKFGAFTCCKACGQTPHTDMELAYSLALTDHFLTFDHLEQISSAMRSGSRPELPKEQEEKFLAWVRGRPEQDGASPLAGDPASLADYLAPLAEDSEPLDDDTARTRRPDEK